MEKFLNDPSSNMDLKSKHFQNMLTRDQKRIKELEKSGKALEEMLQKKNPELLKTFKDKQEESKNLRELKLRNKELEATLELKRNEYEVKVVEFRQNYDKMRLEYERKLQESGVPGAGNVVFKLGNASKADKENLGVKIKDESASLRKRIQELEKELSEAKQYYLKKAKNLSKRPAEKKTKITEKNPQQRPNTGGSPQKMDKPDATIEERKQKNLYSSNRERPASRSAERKSRPSSPEKEKAPKSFDQETTFSDGENLIDKVLKFCVCETSQIYFDICKEIDKIKHCSMNMNIAGMRNLSINLIEFLNSQIQNKALSTKEIEGVIESLRNLITSCENAGYRGEELEKSEAPAEALIFLEKTLKRKLWLNLITHEYIPKLRTNNLMNSKDQVNEEGDFEELKFRLFEAEKEAGGLRNIVEALKKNILNLEKERKELFLLIEKAPRDSRSVNQDLMFMEKKLEMLEQNYLQKELELNFTLKKLGQPFSIDNNEIAKIKKYYDQEKTELLRVIDMKNKQISEYKIELSGILRELDSLRGT